MITPIIYQRMGGWEHVLEPVFVRCEDDDRYNCHGGNQPKTLVVARRFVCRISAGQKQVNPR